MDKELEMNLEKINEKFNTSPSRIFKESSEIVEYSSVDYTENIKFLKKYYVYFALYALILILLYAIQPAMIMEEENLSYKKMIKWSFIIFIVLILSYAIYKNYE